MGFVHTHTHKGMRGMFCNFFKKSQKVLADSTIEELKLALQLDSRTSSLSFLGYKALQFLICLSKSDHLVY